MNNNQNDMSEKSFEPINPKMKKYIIKQTVGGGAIVALVLLFILGLFNKYSVETDQGEPVMNIFTVCIGLAVFFAVGGVVGIYSVFESRYRFNDDNSVTVRSRSLLNKLSEQTIIPGQDLRYDVTTRYDVMPTHDNDRIKDLFITVGQTEVLISGLSNDGVTKITATLGLSPYKPK